jgi:hypothetical protein
MPPSLASQLPQGNLYGFQSGRPVGRLALALALALAFDLALDFLAPS